MIQVSQRMLRSLSLTNQARTNVILWQRVNLRLRRHVDILLREQVPVPIGEDHAALMDFLAEYGPEAVHEQQGSF